MTLALDRKAWLGQLAARARWQPDVEPHSGDWSETDFWKLTQFDEIHGLPLSWQTVALGPDEWPDEGAEGSIDEFREATRFMSDYLVGVRGVWSGFPDPPEFSIWRMMKDETNWRFLGHFDRWPTNWTKQGQ